MLSRDRLSRITLGQIVILAFVLRISWAFLVPIHPISDPSIYDMLAQRLANGYGYSWPSGSKTAYWPVGTSAFYGAIYYMFGRNLFIAALCNVVLGTLLVASTFALARTQFSRGIALLSAFITAIWPTWIGFTSILSSEMPANLLFVAGLALALSRRGPTMVRVVLSTALLVGSAYCRANMLPFILIIPLLVAIRDGKFRDFLIQGSIALLVALLLIAPWAMRNADTFGKIVPISTNFGVNLWIGNNPEADGGYMPPPPPPGYAALPEDEVKQDLIYQQSAKDYIYGHPGRYLQLCVHRLVIALDRETHGISWNDQALPDVVKAPGKIAMTGYWYIVFLLSVAGVVLFVWRQPANLLSSFVLLPCAIMATPILIMSSERFHYGIAPFVAIFAAYALARWSAARRGDASPSIVQAHSHA